MQPGIRVRAARDAADDDEIARIASAAFPGWPLTEVAGARQRRGDRFHLKLVAEGGLDRLSAFGFIEVPDVAARPGRLRIRLVVDPARTGSRIGSSLYQALEAEARYRGATELVTEALQSHPRAVQFARDRGYAVYNSRIESRLGIGNVDAERVARSLNEHTDRMFASGMRIASYRQMSLAPDDAPRRMYQLFLELWRDVPFGISGADPIYESYVAEEIDDPAFRSAGSFIALDGRDWVGLCSASAPGGRLMTSMTGVVRRWRGRGVAHWLKLHSIRYALEVGAAEVRTFNDAANAAMLALNRKLGFVPVETDLRMRKELQ